MINKYIIFFEEHLFYVLIPIIIVIGVISYKRFIINQDYIVAYNGLCDPNISTCFSECKDDSCSVKSFYTKMQKYSLDLYLECGKDITECKNANICLPSDRECSIMYCNPNTKGDICSTEMDKIKNNFPDDVILPFNSDNNL